MNETTKKYWIDWMMAKSNPIDAHSFEKFVANMEQLIGDSLESGDATDEEMQIWAKDIQDNC